ncbi:MFS general substrate transporter [Venturia nashicola]|uniref:MFS general substrate transporter n=1 Tax=Venturia nashicola TaxID=86259 RepID=A0A4Z1PJQ6_9PEZI|nr:MFS general substrate transporter [Venturia nashicola]
MSSQKMPEKVDNVIDEKHTEHSSGEVLDISEGQVHELDEAEFFLRENNFTHGYLQEVLQDEAANKKLVRRVNLILMPLLCGTYLLQYIDKQALSYSAVFDLFTSTGTTSDEYSWLASIFYFGYLVAEWPASYAAQHWPTGTVVSCFVITWGAILMLTSASHNFTGLSICRFFLGCCEALITPCFMMIVGMWYTRKEQPSRAGIFYCFNGVGSMVGGILFYAVGQNKSDFAVWRIIFLLCGGVTIVWGIVLLFFLPNNIMTAKHFTKEDKALLIARSQSNGTGVYNKTIKFVQVKEAFCDAQIWILFFFVLLNEVFNGGFANFGKLIVKGIAGGDALKTTAYGIPSGAFQVFFVFGGPYLASKFHNIRTYVMALYLCPTLIGTCLVWQLPRSNSNGLLVSYYMMGSFVASLVLALQLPASNVGGYTKRVTATALVFLAYCVGNIIGPHAFIASEAPVYETGCQLGIACAAIQIVLAFALRTLLMRRNKKRDAMGLPPPDLNTAIEDLTDFENPHFRYSY